MVKRKWSQERVKPQNQRISVRQGAGPNQHELSIALQNLPSPLREFSCTTASIQVRSNVTNFVFGQFMIGNTRLSNAITIDVPQNLIPPFVRTFDPNFREALALACDGLDQMESYTVGSQQPQTVGYVAHIVKVLVNNFAGMLDFYELVPTIGSPPSVEPVIRVRTLPAVIRYLVDTLDQFVARMPSDSPDLSK